MSLRRLFRTARLPRLVIALPQTLLRSRPVSVENVRSCHARSELPENKYSDRTHTCGELRETDVGKRVALYGWVYLKRNDFVTLRDLYGMVQLHLDKDLVANFKALSLESVICAKGIVRERSKPAMRMQIGTGPIEVHVDSIEVVNACRSTLTMARSTFIRRPEAIANKYRYLYVRQEHIQRTLVKRSELVRAFRNYLTDLEFIEIETPTLSGRAPTGAQSYAVASSSQPGHFYNLTRSPLQYKQLLMTAGFDKYFQVARCYREEASSADSLQEFTQIDLEMSFVTKESLMALLEKMVVACWPQPIARTPFPVLDSSTAMELYGTHQPDTRFDLLIEKLPRLTTDLVMAGHVLRGIRVDGSFELGKFLSRWRQEAAAAGFSCDINLISKGLRGFRRFANKRELEDLEGSVIIAWGLKDEVLTTMGKIRVQLAEAMKLIDSKKSTSSFTWVVNFPLFDSRDGKSILSDRHPSTAPDPADQDCVGSAPKACRSTRFDLILNGWEVGSGAMRVHSADMQRAILEGILDTDLSRHGFQLDALASGTPPHGGFAFGLDRLVAALCSVKDVRDVVAFPKMADGRCLMSGAPVKLDGKELQDYNIEP